MKSPANPNLLPAQYEQGLIKTEILKKSLDSDPFKLLGVPKQDKIAFFFLNGSLMR